MSVSDVVIVLSPVLAAASALGGAWLGSRATLSAQHAAADRQDACDEVERQSELRGTARLIHLELIEAASRLELSLQIGARMLIGQHKAQVWDQLRPGLARHDDTEVWTHVLNASFRTRHACSRGRREKPWATKERDGARVALDTVRRAIDTLAPLAGAVPLTEALRRIADPG